MNNTTPTPVPVQPPKQSHKGSITGFVLAVVALAVSGFGSMLIHAKYKPVGPQTGSANEVVGNAVASGTTKFLGTVFGVPLITLGIVLSILSVLFVIIRLRKVKASGLVFSVVAVLLAVWSFMISIRAFDLIRFHPQ